MLIQFFKKQSILCLYTIGIHVRLTDYHHHLGVLYNATILKPRFYEKAIDYFKAKYENPLFIVVSDDEGEASEIGK